MTLKKITSILLLSSFCFLSKAETTDSLEMKFDLARALLAKRDITNAIETLREIYVTDPESGNINFMMGAAYTELPSSRKEAIYHLKKAIPQVTAEYMVGNFREKRAPVHLYYYLTLALVEEDRCEEAQQTLTEFIKYESKVDPYFIAEGKKHMEKCPFESKLDLNAFKKLDSIPRGYEPKKVKEKPKPFTLDSTTLAEKGIVIEKLEYTTKAPLYGVQIGSNKTPTLTNNFSKIKNIDVFIDYQGIIRYVVGHFSYPSQAENLLKSLQEKGYKDAFIVNVNDAKKYSNEVVSYQNVNLRAGFIGGIEYYVQLGSFTERIPKEITDMYLKVDNIEEVKYDGKTLLLVGKYKSFKEADKQKEELLRLTNQESIYVVAFNRGKKIGLQDAINQTEK